MDETVRPSLKVTGLHIEGLKSLRRVDWPADGMGWGGHVPDMVMVGGVNGSGKTTLLDTLVRLVRNIQSPGGVQDVPPGFLAPGATVNAWVDLEVASNATGASTLRIIHGDQSFVARNRTATSRWVLRSPAGAKAGWTEGGAVSFSTLATLLSRPSAYESSDFPRLICLRSDRRLSLPSPTYKSPGQMAAPSEFSYESRPVGSWEQSIEAVLYAARWADLNAKEEGRPEEATHFESYSRAFQAFFGDSKSLAWEHGELTVRIADTGVTHPLAELSSGEQQVILMMADLYRHWRPGSLVLIDEPELHFHATWQTRLWLMLAKWHDERGGQVIVTTQSTHLFGVAEPGTTVLLGKRLA
jgi:ABC-type transport system involved in cytochrome c biogenesis ATPase subunit